MALLWMLAAACLFMASRHWRDRYAVASLTATVLAFMSKESAAIGPALIVALAWARRPGDEGLLRGGARALVAALPWIAIAAAYFAYRTWIFGDPFRFYPGTSPGLALLSGHWLAALPASGDWWPRVLPEAGPRRAYAVTALLLAVAMVSAAAQDARERRVLSAIALAGLAALALLFSHWSWSATGEGGRVLYTIAAIVALAVAVPLRSAARRLRVASWVVALMLVGSGLLLTRTAVEHRAQAGAQMHALVAAVRATADSMPAGSYGFVIVPDHVGTIPFARNAQGGLMSPPTQPRSLSTQLVVQLVEDLPRWPALLERNIIGRLKNEPLASVTADPEASGSLRAPSVPDRFYCWSSRRRALVALPLSFEPGFSDWEAVWARALDAADCRP
jgi:hypothetical protein